MAAQKKVAPDRSPVKRPSYQNITAFAAFIEAEMERQKISGYTLEERAKTGGLSIDHSTVWRITKGKVPEIRSTTVAALAFGLNLPVSQLQAILNNSGADDSPETVTVDVTLSGALFAKLADAARQHRRSVEGEIEAIIASVIGEEDVEIDQKKVHKARTIHVVK